MNLFGKKSQVKVGKQTQVPAEKLQTKQQSPFAAVGNAWNKLNSMNRKQAYTWGAIAVVGVIALLMLLSLSSGEQADDFMDYESRGYDLANMPFSTDEAEQMLLASKYPDMQDNQAFGLYSEEEKAERQEEDAAEALAVDQDGVSDNANYVEGRYYTGAAGGGAGGSGRGPRTRTQIGQLNSATLKGGSGSGISGNFGPSGDFSNFKSQEKGNDKKPLKGPGSGNARRALYQTALGSRAAAGQKDNKLLNAKRAMMGGDVEGSKAFMNDSGGVDLGEARGLNLDTNAPVGSGDLSGLDDALSRAQTIAKEKEEEEDWKTQLWHGLVETALNGLVNMALNVGQSYLTGVINNGIAVKQQESALYNQGLSEANQAYQAALKESGGADTVTFSFQGSDYTVPSNIGTQKKLGKAMKQSNGLGFDGYKTAVHSQAQQAVYDSNAQQQAMNLLLGNTGNKQGSSDNSGDGK